MHGWGDARRAELESAVDRGTGQLVPGSLTRLHTSETQALEDLVGAIGEPRARAYGDRPLTPTKVISRRRMMVMRAVGGRLRSPPATVP